MVIINISSALRVPIGVLSIIFKNTFLIKFCIFSWFQPLNVITISEFSEKILKPTLGKNTKITRIYNPIDIDENPEKVDQSKNGYYLYVGRVSKEKGVDVFCQAI